MMKRQTQSYWRSTRSARSSQTNRKASGWFHRHYSAEEREELIRKHGCIPEETPSSITLESVLRWGKPWWHIHEIIYERNSRVGSTTLEDDIRCWKALLYSVAEKINEKCFPPAHLKQFISEVQWRRDLFDEAIAALWQIVTYGRKTMLSIKMAVFSAISLALRGKATPKIPEDVDMDRLTSRYRTYDTPVVDEIIHRIDGVEDAKRLDVDLAIRLKYRLNETFWPGAKQLYQDAKRGKKSPKWILQLMETHRKLLASSRSAPSEKLVETADLFYLAMVDVDPTSIIAELASMVGNENVLKLVEIFGGTTIKVPSVEEIRRAAKNASIWVDARNGVPVNEIAAKHSVSEAMVLRSIGRWNELDKAKIGAEPSN